MLGPRGIGQSPCPPSNHAAQNWLIWCVTSARAAGGFALGSVPAHRHQIADQPQARQRRWRRLQACDEPRRSMRCGGFPGWLPSVLVAAVRLPGAAIVRSRHQQLRPAQQL